MHNEINLKNLSQKKFKKSLEKSWKNIQIFFVEKIFTQNWKIFVFFFVAKMRQKIESVEKGGKKQFQSKCNLKHLRRSKEWKNETLKFEKFIERFVN